MRHVAFTVMLSLGFVTSAAAESLDVLRADVTNGLKRALLERTDPTEAARELREADAALDAGRSSAAREHLDAAIQLLGESPID
jgi:hypothetical protein